MAFFEKKNRKRKICRYQSKICLFCGQNKLGSNLKTKTTVGIGPECWYPGSSKFKAPVSKI